MCRRIRCLHIVKGYILIKEKWIQINKKSDFKAVAEKFNIDQVLARIIRNRDIIGDEEIDKFLNGDLSVLHDGRLMKDMDIAVSLIREKITNGAAIRIIGDYDVDGICATYILLKTLKSLGATVDTVIPHRILDGYGLNEQLIENARNDGIDTIITCDNGIAAKNQIDMANELGMTVIVTDHHEVPYEMADGKKKYILPNAQAVVDPKRDDCNYPFKGICGAVVAFKLSKILMEEMAPEIVDTITKELLPFAALATNCDVMELLDENRVIVKEGLKLMADPVNKGIKALIIALGLTDKNISTYHLGFVIGPTINATGRLDTAKRALELFSTNDFNEACLIAVELKELNESRKKITEDGATCAVRIIEEEGLYNDRVLVIYLPECHESVAGIIAGRIKEKYYRPTIVLTNAEDGIKGSGRSIEAYNMYEELTRVNDLFTKYGGHPMAAGISLKSLDDIDSLRDRLNRNCTLTPEQMMPTVKIDVPMPLSYISMPLTESLKLLEPFGVGNPHPMFATKGVSLISYTKVGRSRIIGKFKIKDDLGNLYEMVYFDDLQSFDEFIVDNFGEAKFEKLLNGRCDVNEILIKMTYQISVNEFNGWKNVQIQMKNYDI